MVRCSTLGHHHKEVLNLPERFLTDAGCSVLKKITSVDFDIWVVISVSGGLWNQSNRIRWFGIFSKTIAFWLGIWCHSQWQYLYSVVKIDFGLAAAKLRETKQNICFVFIFLIRSSIVAQNWLAAWIFPWSATAAHRICGYLLLPRWWSHHWSIERICMYDVCTKSIC